MAAVHRSWFWLPVFLHSNGITHLDVLYCLLSVHQQEYCIKDIIKLSPLFKFKASESSWYSLCREMHSRPRYNLFRSWPGPMRSVLVWQSSLSSLSFLSTVVNFPSSIIFFSCKEYSRPCCKLFSRRRKNNRRRSQVFGENSVGFYLWTDTHTERQCFFVFNHLVCHPREIELCFIFFFANYILFTRSTENHQHRLTRRRRKGNRTWWRWRARTDTGRETPREAEAGGSMYRERRREWWQLD